MENIFKKIIIAIISGILLVILGYAFWQFFNQGSVVSTTNQSLGNQTVTQDVGTPLKLTIPKINVAADIEPAGLDKNGSVAVPSGPTGVTWYKLGAKPGEKGSAVIAGHYGPWVNGAGSVFDNLNSLAIGDKVYIQNDKGDTLTFEVIKKNTYSANQVVPEVFNKDDASYLNLVTCSGDWLKDQKTFTNRLVVFTKLVN